MIGRVFFGALAVVDAILLAYLFISYDWFHYGINESSISSPAGFLVIWVLWATVAAEKLFFAGYFAVVGAGIWKELTRREVTRRLAVLTTPVLVIALIGIGVAATWNLYEIAARPPGFINDRLTVFDALAGTVDDEGIDLLGTGRYAAGSLGRFLIVLLAGAYLAEKYLLQAWRVRWPVPILPLIAIGAIGWMVYDGERRNREFAASREWRAVAPQVPWIDAVAACETLGPGWRLPLREELARYLATYPPEIQPWTGAAWTSTSADGGGWAVAVDLQPRFSGRWNKGSEPTRDESLCEFRTQPGYATDWFAALRPEVCARTRHSPYLFTPGLSLTALQSGNVAVTQPAQAAICVRGEPMRFPVRERRGYRDEQNYTRAADFRAAMLKKCGLEPDRDRAACFVFAPDLPPFEETGDQRLMRAFCELARNGEGCFRYAMSMDQYPEAADRAARYRALACKRGFAPACS
jgi:hypothetical protein